MAVYENDPGGGTQRIDTGSGFHHAATSCHHSSAFASTKTLVLELGELTRDAEAVSESLWNPELLEIVGGKRDADRLSERRRPGANIDCDIEKLA